MKIVRIGIIGLGYWGPHYLRNFLKHPYAKVIWGCDIDQKIIQKFSAKYPEISFTQNYADILRDETVDCVAIATPPETHYDIAKIFLTAKKHVFIAKPLATNFIQAKELVLLARKNAQILFSDLTYLYSPEVEYLKKSILQRKFGKPLYYESNRSNFGIIQKGVNVLWDLAPHDISIIDYCFGYKPVSVHAMGSMHINFAKKREVANLAITYSNGFCAYIHTSWLSPIKIRNTILVGSKKSLVFDDTKKKDKITVYEKTIHMSSGKYSSPIYESGKVLVPKLNQIEPLFKEIDVLIKVINKKAHVGMKRDLQIVEILEAADMSLTTGTTISLTS